MANRIYSETLHQLERKAGPGTLLRNIHDFVNDRLATDSFYFTMAAVRLSMHGSARPLRLQGIHRPVRRTLPDCVITSCVVVDHPRCPCGDPSFNTSITTTGRSAPTHQESLRIPRVDSGKITAAATIVAKLDKGDSVFVGALWEDDALNLGSCYFKEGGMEGMTPASSTYK